MDKFACWSVYIRLCRCAWEHRDAKLLQYSPGVLLAFEIGPEGPELDSQHKGSQQRQMCASSNPKMKTPFAALRAARVLDSRNRCS